MLGPPIPEVGCSVRNCDASLSAITFILDSDENLEFFTLSWCALIDCNLKSNKQIAAQVVDQRDNVGVCCQAPGMFAPGDEVNSGNCCRTVALDVCLGICVDLMIYHKFLEEQHR